MEIGKRPEFQANMFCRKGVPCGCIGCNPGGLVLNPRGKGKSAKNRNQLQLLAEDKRLTDPRNYPGRPKRRQVILSSGIQSDRWLCDYNLDAL